MELESGSMRPEMEVEVKVACQDLDEIEKKVGKMGARAIEETTQEDLYLAHPCRDFGESDEALRIRTSEKGSKLTYKGPKLDMETKTREELEIGVDPKVRSILEKMGFTEVMTVRKRRKIFMRDDVEISLDRVEELGDFVELEYKGQSMEKGRMMIFQTMESLGLEGSERRSYLELLMERN